MAAGRREPRRKKALFFASFTCSLVEKGEGRETSTFSALLSVPLREIVILTDCCLGKMSATDCGRLKPEPIFFSSASPLRCNVRAIVHQWVLKHKQSGQPTATGHNASLFSLHTRDVDNMSLTSWLPSS
jgi:hypothetical protein